MNEIKRDLITLLRIDHQRIKQLFYRAYDNSNFDEMVRFLMAHEVAEELTVYPAVRKLPGGDAIADARLEEQRQLQPELERLSKLDSDAFRNRLGVLENEVIDHSELEEVTAFSLLAEELTLAELVRLGEKYQKAKAAAPTHQKASAPSLKGKIFIGPVASWADRIRDAVRRK